MIAPGQIHAPNAGLWLTDYSRGMLQLGSLLWTWPLLRDAPHGDGHGVLVLPGLGASDRSTTVLRGYLRYLGYRAHGWGLGANLGPTARVVTELPRRLQHLSDRDDGPVTVIGWSLGGIFARRLARESPTRVRQVITLGSPIRLRDHGHTNARAFYHVFKRLHVEELRLPLEDGLGPLPVPATSIYSRLDGIVAWQSCLDLPSELAENIEVRAAHFGLGWHPAVLSVTAERLAQPRGQWAPYATGAPPPG